MKDVLISSTTSMSDDSFASEFLTTECILSSNEISYSLKSLIDIEAADYLFINEVIVQIVYNQLQIKFLTLIKAKSIREFDDHYVKNSLFMSSIQIWLFKIIWLTQLLCWSLD